MPRKITLTDKQLLNELKSLYGVELTAPDIRGFCASRDINYQTVTRRLQPFKLSRGKWNLELTQESVEQIERSFSAPAVLTTFDSYCIP